MRWANSSPGTAGAKAAVAFCVGPDHAEECERNYDGVAALPRPAAQGHWLIQPVIDVAPDGTSAKMRHRLLHIDAAPESRGFSDGMYPNNAAKLEDGIWKLDVMAPDQRLLQFPELQGRLGAQGKRGSAEAAGQERH